MLFWVLCAALPLSCCTAPLCSIAAVVLLGLCCAALPLSCSWPLACSLPLTCCTTIVMPLGYCHTALALMLSCLGQCSLFTEWAAYPLHCPGCCSCCLMGCSPPGCMWAIYACVCMYGYTAMLTVVHASGAQLPAQWLSVPPHWRPACLLHGGILGVFWRVLFSTWSGILFVLPRGLFTCLF